MGGAEGSDVCLQASRKTYNNIINNLKTLRIMAYVIGEDCIACGTCIDECPVEAISEGDKYSINPDLCTECGSGWMPLFCYWVVASD